MTTGFQLPSSQDKPGYVREMFDRIAEGYDAANDGMTGGMHRLWKRRLIGLLDVKPGHRALDLATGTGDLARLLAQQVGADGAVTGLDFSSGMLAQARAQGEAGITFIEGDMQALPFETAAFDRVSVGFGLRNVADLDLALTEMLRVLKPGGRVASLEMGRPRLAPIRLGVALYNAVVPPLVGRLTTGHAAPYQYLHASALAFVSQDELADRMRAVGFANVRVHDVALGALAIVVAERP
jgi:demethylmenaquinone methyltransferase/2-methoxy-6-polyprenyl-1,4-benzoquinol methylase